MFLGQKSRNHLQILSFFFIFLRISDQIFYIDKVIKNQDSGKCHKISAKLYCSSKLFWLVRLCDHGTKHLNAGSQIWSVYGQHCMVMSGQSFHESPKYSASDDILRVRKINSLDIKTTMKKHFHQIHNC